jgi:hypothetical protein
VYLVWGAAEIEFARSVAEQRAPLRPALVEVWRAGRAGGRPDLPAETLAGCLDVLRELGLDPAADAPGKVDLELSATYRAAVERLAVVERHLVAQLPATG